MTMNFNDDQAHFHVVLRRETKHRPAILQAALFGGMMAGVAAITTGCSSASATEWSKAEPVAQVAVGATKPTMVAASAVVAPAEDAIRGVIAPQLQATIASRMTAGITAMPYKVGQSFGAGAMLARFDCSITQAQYAAANAATAAYKKTYDTNVELDQYQAVGKNEVGVSKANLGKAVAESRAVAAELSQCAVYAPFSGTVVEEIAHNHEVAATGQPLMKIQSNGALEVQLIVPSNWMTWVKPGAPFAFKIDETGATVTGRVTRLGASVDPVSKTIRITGSISRDGTAPILPGMSGSATFDKRGSDGKPA